MALPSYWISLNRKDLAERAIVAKREREASRIQKCQETDSYHKELALKSTKYKSLEESQSLKTPRANEESRIKENLKADIKERLEIRRRKLSHLLAVENEQYMKELKELRDRDKEKDPWNISRLKAQIEELQRKRREGEQNMQKRYMHHLFKSSDIYLKENSDEQLKQEAAEAWEHRKEELEKLSLERKQREEEKYKILQLEQMKAAREARETEILQLEEQEKWSCVVQEKMSELSAAENEVKKLKKEQQILIEHMETLLSLKNRREKIRDIQRKGVQKIHGMWKPKEKLRRMSNEIQHGLDLDCKLLTSLSAFNNTASEETALALLNLDCVKEVEEKFKMQILLEKERDLEILQLYNEEASKLWEKREEEWSLELLARDEIMNDLFKTIVGEINKKMDCIIGEQRKFIRIKDDCLRAIDEAHENAKSVHKTLDDKRMYFCDKAKRLEEQLECYNKKLPSEPVMTKRSITSPIS